MYVHVQVVAGAKKERVTKKDTAKFYITVKEKAERNMANARIREILASEFQVPIGTVRILTGHRSPSKIYTIDV